MARRGYISLVLLALYLWATGGVWSLSLACDCTTAEHADGHICCVAEHHAGHGHDLTDEELCATCMCDRHSTEIALYTTTDRSENEHSLRCAVLALPHCLAAAQAARLSVPKFHKERILVPPVPVRATPCSRVAGLRAPPVLV